MENQKKGKTFKERYTTDPEYKEKHNQYIREKVECDCGRMVMRVAMAKHKRTAIHERFLGKNNQHNGDLEELVERYLKEKLQVILNK